MKFTLQFIVRDSRRGIHSILEVDSLDHPLYEEQGYLLEGEGIDLDLVVSTIELQQKGGEPNTVVVFELDSKYVDGSGAVSAETAERIRRVLEYNGWIWDIKPA